MMKTGTVASASKSVAHLSKDVEDARGGLTALKNAKQLTGLSLAPDSVTKTGAAVTSTAKRTARLTW